MKPSISLVLLTLAAAAGGVFTSPAALADHDDHSALDSASFVSTRSRAEVHAEAVDAVRKGALGAGLDQGHVLQSLMSPLAAGKTRAQVKAELIEARRLGLVGHGWRDNDPVIPTEAQMRQIAQAGERANAVHVSAR
jgi:hypothetical protein